MRVMMPHMKRIVVIGGGTGAFVVLRGLKDYLFHLSAIVTMSDSGGSNKRLRDEFGILPTSDIRQCLVALSDENGGVGLLRQLFMYRFEKGEGISGMTFGNLFMAALTDILGSQAEAIRQTRKVLRIKGDVIPVSYTKTDLVATYEDGTTLNEEHLIDEPPHDGRLRIKSIKLVPSAKANPDALAAIKKADLIIIGPGDLYTSIIPNLLVWGVADVIKKSRAKVVYVLNLMTKFGQTHNFTAKEHVEVVSRFIGKRINTVLVNKTKLPQNAVDIYKKYNENQVVDDLSKSAYYQVIRADILSPGIISRVKSDKLVRSLIRHDSVKLAMQLVKLI